jgi:hypothetical protein
MDFDYSWRAWPAAGNVIGIEREWSRESESLYTRPKHQDKNVRILHRQQAVVLYGWIGARGYDCVKPCGFFKK